MSPSSERLGSDLCQSCGACCDGTLFKWVPVEPTELPRLAKLRLDIVDTPEGGRFDQRCARLEGRVCGIYEDRPVACREYSCKLRTRVTAGEIALDAALAIVAELVRARGELNARIALLPDGASTPTGNTDPKTLLLRVAITRLIERRFQNPEKPSTRTDRRADG